MAAKRASTLLGALCLLGLIVAGQTGLLAAEVLPGGTEMAPLPKAEAEPGQAFVVTGPAPKARDVGFADVGAASCSTSCGPSSRFWASADYLHWWTRGGFVPSLVVAAPSPDDALTTVFGDEKLNGGARSGFRVTLGGWVDRNHTWGVEGDYFDLGEKSTGFDSGISNGNPILARPFLLPPECGTDFITTAFPEEAAGRIQAEVSNYFQSAGLLVRRQLFCCDRMGKFGNELLPGFSGRVDFIGGYRFYRMLDSVNIHETTIGLSGPNFGTQFDVEDSIGTANEFHGGEMGLSANFTRGRFSLGVLAKVAMGYNHEVAKLRGSTLVTPAIGPADVTEGGFLVQDTNSGDHARNEFSIIPQVGLDVGFQATQHLRVYAGYDLLYWSDVLRAGDQIDLRIDVPPGPGAEFPAFAFRSTDFWAQGIRVGAEFRY